ncbi:unnamed protein product [Eruca vesicaria subsp. sativa]|uniref:DC1 domain-containing protein n=1 Tax=Eruca vesicaria subsp. sativa TaxID=29727 RepID=A0ABC8K8A2_ERUVS|nr:unnamed protein product [Eruca vesicaria subsp. sativa]
MSQGTPKRNTINHFTHNHPLTEVNVVCTYRCNGCKLYGEGKTYRCNECDYDLHEYCATCLPTLRNTWHAPDHELNLISSPAHMSERVCYVCQVFIQGMFYKCKHCSFESHPLCTHGPAYASYPDATLTRPRSLHDPHGMQAPWSPHHYSQGNPYWPYPYGGGYHPHHQHEHQSQHPYMNMGSPKVDSKKDSSKGKGGILEGVQAALALAGTMGAQFVAEEYIFNEE